MPNWCNVLPQAWNRIQISNHFGGCHLGNTCWDYTLGQPPNHDQHLGLGHRPTQWFIILLLPNSQMLLRVKRRVLDDECNWEKEYAFREDCRHKSRGKPQWIRKQGTEIENRISCLLSCFTLVQRKRSEIPTLHLNVFRCIIIIESVMVLPLLCLCVCVCSDVLKNSTVPFAQRIRMHKGVWTSMRVWSRTPYGVGKKTLEVSIAEA